MSRPFSRRPPSVSGPYIRVNGKIRAPEVRVIGTDGQQLGVIPLGKAITLARSEGVDLVEVAPNASPPVCRLVDYGRYRYEQSKRDKESKKHQHANRVKEIQLRATIDPHDFGVKVQHASEFLCEDMKVKVSLRFRGREMAHTEFGFQVVERFVQAVSPYGHPDAPPRLVGRGLNVMFSPLPRNKRAALDTERPVVPGAAKDDKESRRLIVVNAVQKQPEPPPNSSFSNNPFSKLDINKG